MLGDGAARPPALASAATALRRVGYMFLPVVPAVPSVAAAVTLASLGVPLAAVSLPPMEGSGGRGGDGAGGGPAAWADAVFGRLAELGAASSNRSHAMSMAVTLDACTMESDSLTRFAAYASVIWGAQALHPLPRRPLLARGTTAD